MRIPKQLFYSLLLFILFLIVNIGFILLHGVTDEVQKSDVIVVLGNKVERNGEPSLRLAKRLDKAAELFKKDYAKQIIVSGGLGKEGFQEGDVMKRYLVAKGIPADKIIADNNGVNTDATAKNTKKLVEDRGWNSVLVVTQYYHVPRTELAMKQEGITNVSGAHAEYFFEARDFYAVPREVVGYYKYLLFNYF